MKYILDNKSNVIKNIKENELSALSIKPSKEQKGVIETKKILLVDSKLKDAYIKQKIDKKVNSLLVKMKYILETDEDGSSNVNVVLDDIQKLKSIMVAKYKEHLTEEEYKNMLKKIILLEEEFKKRYNAKQIYKELMMEEDEIKGKSR